ncbi:MAG: hypothetical protein ACI4K7_10205, partial [Oscillospiraceae bacterium]
MNTKKVLAGLSAVVLAASMTACGSSDSDSSADTTGTEADITTTEATEWTGDNIEVEALDESDTLDIDISGQTLKWLGIYDLNPTNDSPERSPEVALFE